MANLLKPTSARNRRRGRAAYKTRQNFAADICAAVAAIAEMPAPLFDTSNWKIAGSAFDGAAVIWEFSTFSAHMSEWMRRDVRNPAFCLLPGLTHINAIAEILASGATIYTAKAKFQLIK